MPVDPTAFMQAFIANGIAYAEQSENWLERKETDQVKSAMLGNLPACLGVMGQTLAQFGYKVTDAHGQQVSFPAVPPTPSGA